MSQQPSSLVLRPSVAKTFFKGLIAIGIFSLFLEVNPSNLLNYLIFLVISILLVLCYMGAKWSTRYVLGPTGIFVNPLMRAEKFIPYSDIEGLTISQGLLARRFHCGSVYIQLSGKRRGSYMSLMGGMAETLRDVKDPAAIYGRIAEAMNPNSMF